MKRLAGLLAMVWVPAISSLAEGALEKDVIKTSAGDVEITFVGHGTLMMTFGGKVIHIDPYSGLADYATLPKADLILITHEHSDHLDPKALGVCRTTNSVVVLTKTCAEKMPGGVVMTNGETRTFLGVKVEAVPAYNIVNKQKNGQPWHPKGTGNGYVLTFGDRRIYVAGDTENTPEMKDLKVIDCAFVPIFLPYTMGLEEAVEGIKAFKPKVLYPYHFGDTDTAKLVEALKSSPDIEVRIRKMK